MSGLKTFSPQRDFSAPQARADGPPLVVTVEEAARQADDAAAAARTAALAEGKAIGRAEAEAEQAAALTALARTIAEWLGEERTQIEARLEKVEAKATRLILALVRKLAARLCDDEGQRVCERIAPQALAAAAASNRFVINVAPGMAAPLRDALAPELTRRGLSPDDYVKPDDNLSEGAIRAEWSGGGVSFDPSERNAAIDALIEDAFARLEGGSPLLKEKDSQHDE